MPGPIGLLDVNHDEIRIRKSSHRTEAYAGLVLREILYEIDVDRLQFRIWKGGEGRRIRVDPLNDPEIGLRLPEADVVVDVVHIGEHLRNGGRVISGKEGGGGARFGRWKGRSLALKRSNGDLLC